MIIKLNRKKAEKALVFVLSVVMLLGILPIGASAEYNPNIEPPHEYEQPPDITGIDDESNTLFSTASSTTFNVANSAQLSNALASITDGSVINITESFTHRSPILIDGISVELNLNSNTLTIETDTQFSGSSLSVRSGATLTVSGSGTLNVISNTGGSSWAAIQVWGDVWINTLMNTQRSTINANGTTINATGNTALSVINGSVAVTNASGEVRAGSLGLGSTVTVNGSATGTVSAGGADSTVTVNGNVAGTVIAGAGAVVTINGHITSSAGRSAVSGGGGGDVIVNGNIIGNNSSGILISDIDNGDNSTVTVNGNIAITNNDLQYGESIGVGLSARNITVTVNGNITINGRDWCSGVRLSGNNNTVIVNGIITAPRYIVVLVLGQGITTLTANQYSDVVDIGGESYRKFNTAAGNVYVKRTILWQPPLSTNRFNDVPNGNWQNAAVSWADRNGITTGSPAGSSTFRPNGDVTRAEFVTFFHRIYGSPAAPPATFRDMPGNVAFQNAISWALAEGITTGSPAGSRTFMPNANITREQIAAMLYRYVGGGVPAPVDRLGGYTDRNRISTWAGAREAVNWAVYNGIMGQNVTTLNPGGNATRAEAVTMLYRVVEIFNIPAP